MFTRMSECVLQPPRGDRGMISTAHCEQWQLNISTNVVLPWFRFPPPPYIFFVCVCFPDPPRGSVLFSQEPLCRVALLPPSLLFDLAPLGWEAGAPDTACVQSESVRRMPGYWGHARVGRSVRKPPPPPPSSILQGEKERRKAGGYFTSHSTEAWGVCSTSPNTHTHGGGGVVASLLSFYTPGCRVDPNPSIWPLRSL